NGATLSSLAGPVKRPCFNLLSDSPRSVAACRLRKVAACFRAAGHSPGTATDVHDDASLLLEQPGFRSLQRIPPVVLIRRIGPMRSRFVPMDIAKEKCYLPLQCAKEGRH